MITIYKCPFYDECCEERTEFWSENELYPRRMAVICKAPFLMNRKTGDKICALTMNENQIWKWSEAVNDIGRTRSKGKNELKSKRKKGRT